MEFGSIIRKHYRVFIMATIVGLLVVSLQFIFQASLGDNFQGIYRQINNDELLYMARAQEIVDGNYFLSNSFLAEHKDGQPMQFFLPDLISAWPAKIFGLGIYPLYAFYDFLLPAILFILTYFIFYLLIRNQFWSLFFSAWIFLIKYFELFNRPISPQFIFIFVLTMILFLLVILKDKQNNKILIVLASINFGWLFYSYPYYWTYISVLLVLLCLVFLWQKKYYLFKRVVVILVLGLALASFYFYQMWQSTKFEFFEETVVRMGAISTHFPSGIKTIIPAAIIMLIYIIYWFKNKKSWNSINSFWLTGVLVSVIVTNQHIITGVNQFFAGHYQMISYFFMIFAVVYLIWQSKLAVKILNHNLMKLLFIIIFAVYFVPNFLQATEFEYETEFSIQRFAPVFDWLNENTVEESVVMANSEKLTDYIPSYTHNNIFFNGPAGLFFISNQELIDRFAILNYWRENRDEYIRNNFKAVYGLQARAMGGHQKQRNKLKKLLGQPQSDLEQFYYPSQYIESISSYMNGISEDDWVAGFDRYQINYLILDNSSRADWQMDIEKYDIFNLITTINQMDIYKIINDHK